MPTYVFGYKPIQGWLAPIITVGLKLYYLDSIGISICGLP
jgi:hypothetical protein